MTILVQIKPFDSFYVYVYIDRIIFLFVTKTNVKLSFSLFFENRLPSKKAWTWTLNPSC